MFNKWRKKSSEESSPEVVDFTWDTAATQALSQAVNQAPVPKPLKGKMEKELKKAAEEQAKSAGRQNVTAEDLMTGLLSKLPSSMRDKVDNAMKQGPEGLKNLENELKNK